MNIPKYSKLFIQMSGKRLSGKMIVRETSCAGNNRRVSERSCPGNVCPGSDCPGNVRYPSHHPLFFESSLFCVFDSELAVKQLN